MYWIISLFSFIITQNFNQNSIVEIIGDDTFFHEQYRSPFESIMSIQSQNHDGTSKEGFHVG
jgi:hypothetical protein